MGFYFNRIPSIVERVFPNCIWRQPNSGNEIFLTFDDGPTPKVTESIVEILNAADIKATFFCLGNKLERYPQIATHTLKSGHGLANHGYHHLSGWKLSKKKYVDNIRKGQSVLKAVANIDNAGFRPPYGHFRMKKKCVMWSLMSGDFDTSLSREDCLNLLMLKTKPGDIVVFHDNEKSFKKLQWVLPRYIDFCREKNFQFGKLSDSD